MDERIVRAVAGAEAYIVGGAVRDQMMGRPAVDIDVVCGQPEVAARAFHERHGGALFPLSERHGAWRVALQGETVDFAALRGSIGEDLFLRDFTINAIAVPVNGGDVVDPTGGRNDVTERRLSSVAGSAFRDDPLRLLRAVRFERELGFRIDDRTERLIRRDGGLVLEPAGERILGELERLGVEGARRLAELGLLAPLGGSLERLDRVEALGDDRLAMVAVFGDSLRRLPVSNRLDAYAGTLLGASAPRDGSRRAIHRFRRATEPWSAEALYLLGLPHLVSEVQAARARDPVDGLLRGDELGVPPGPEVGRLLEEVAEERAVGTITTRAEALAFVERRRR